MYHKTLNEALEAGGSNLVGKWPLGVNIGYDQTARIVSNGTFITVYRDNRGMYETAISYQSRCEDFVQILRN